MIESTKEINLSTNDKVRFFSRITRTVSHQFNNFKNYVSDIGEKMGRFGEWLEVGSWRFCPMTDDRCWGRTEDRRQKTEVWGIVIQNELLEILKPWINLKRSEESPMEEE